MIVKQTTRKRFRASSVSAMLAVFATLLGAADNGERWWGHVAQLSFHGQEPGGRSEKRPKPAEYVAAQLEKAGVLPAGKNGYMQPVKLRSRRTMEQYSSLSLSRGGAERKLVLGEDAIVDMSFDPAPMAQAPLVFVGYGLSIPELGYDDLAGLDLHGKIAVVLSGGPPAIPAPVRAHYQSVEERNKALRRKAGVYGILTIPNPANATAWPHLASSRLETALSLADPAFEQDDDLELSIIVNPERAGVLFEGSGHTLGELFAAADAGKPLPRFPLMGSLRASIAIERNQMESQNVVGVLPGSDPALKNEYIAISGRLDHHSTADGSAGAASLLEIAEALHDSGVKLRRSLLFVFLTAEDQGLLGSQFFTHYPAVATRSIVADLDLNMGYPASTRDAITVSASKESDLGALVRAATARSGIRVTEEADARRTRFTDGSDYSFILCGTPSVSFATGLTDLRQPVDKPSASRFAAMVLEVAKTAANRADRPHWLAGSFFNRFSR